MWFTAEWWRDVRYEYIRTSILIVAFLSVAIKILDATFPEDINERIPYTLAAGNHNIPGRSIPDQTRRNTAVASTRNGRKQGNSVGTTARTPEKPLWEHTEDFDGS